MGCHRTKWVIFHCNVWLPDANMCLLFASIVNPQLGNPGIFGDSTNLRSRCFIPAVCPRPAAVLGMMMPAEWQRVDGSSFDDSIKHGWLGTPAWKIGIVGTFHRSQCVFCHVWHRRVRRSWQEWWCNGDFSWDRMGYWWWNPSKQSHPPNIQTPLRWSQEVV